MTICDQAFVCAVFEIYTYLSLIPLDMYARFVDNNCNIPARPGPSYATNPLSADYQTFTYNGELPQEPDSLANPAAYTILREDANTFMPPASSRLFQ